MKANTQLLFPNSVKGHNSVKQPYRVIALSQIVSLVMINKCLNLHKISLNSNEEMANVEVLQ